METKAKRRAIAALVLVLLFIPALCGCGAHQDTQAGAKDKGGLSGLWQTASMAYEADGTMLPEYHVRFTDTEIVYGHMTDGAFVPDHADRIASFAETAAGCRVQAEASNGVRYSYQTSADDPAVLEYYETWDEEDFPAAYRGGASLGKCAG